MIRAYNFEEGCPQSEADARADGKIVRCLVTILNPEDVERSAPNKTSELSSVVSMKTLAKALRMDRSACRKYVLRLGYHPVKRRTSDSCFQTALTLTDAEARAIWAARRSDGYVSGSPPDFTS